MASHICLTFMADANGGKGNHKACDIDYRFYGFHGLIGFPD